MEPISSTSSVAKKKRMSSHIQKRIWALRVALLQLRVQGQASSRSNQMRIWSWRAALLQMRQREQAVSHIDLQMRMWSLRAAFLQLRRQDRRAGVR